MSPLLPCGTFMLAHLATAPLPSGPPDDAPPLRNTFGDLEFVHETEHFAVRWGRLRDEAEVAEMVAVGEALEVAWDELHGVWGYPEPDGADVYKFNVYLGDDGGPLSYNTAGYFTYDDMGWPMIVVAPDTLDSSVMRETMAHEYFHAAQDATGHWRIAPQGAWFFESSAMWLEGQLYPESESWAGFSFALLQRPDLGLEAFPDNSEWNAGSYHPYGTAAFVKWLTDETGPDLVHDAWLGDFGGDPLLVLESEAEVRGLVLADAWEEFSLRLIDFDFPDGPLLREIDELTADQTDARRFVGAFSRTPLLHHSPAVSLGAYARHHWAVTPSPSPTPLKVEGWTKDLRAWFVVQRGETFEFTDLGRPPLTLPALDADAVGTLVVISVDDGERSPALRVRLDEAPRGACGCGHSGEPQGIAAGLVILALARRRSRPPLTAAPPSPMLSIRKTT